MNDRFRPSLSDIPVSPRQITLYIGIAVAGRLQLSMAIYFDPPLANKIDPPFIV